MTITVGVYLGKKDRFLRNWYDVLPRGQFPLLVKYCIQSYLKGVYFPLDTICDRETFRQRIGVLQELAPTQRNVSFTKEDGAIFDWVNGVDNGYRSEEIKNILKETIIHTLLEEPERIPLARQSYPRRFGGYWQEPSGDATYEREGAAALESRDVPRVKEGSNYGSSHPTQPGSIRIEELYNMPNSSNSPSPEDKERPQNYARWINR